MCGIGGVMFFDGAGETRAREIGSLLEGALRHRGPDGGDVWSHSSGGVSVALAHRRLAILDLSTAASQPMVSDRGSVLTYNGEVYNFGDLRRDLEAAGHAFASTSDTEVVLQALESWDRDALPRFDGMFAFGYWDAPAQRLLLARDRFGIKPLYYFAGDGLFVFASEIRALLATGLVPRRLDRRSLDFFLRYQTAPTPMTLIEGVSMLEPGESLVVEKDGRLSRRPYWRLLDRMADVSERISFADARERTRELLEASVRAHLISDVPVGVFLSGGIDSGALVSTLKSLEAPIRTFTIGFDESPLDESAAAAEVADLYGTEHTTLRLTGNEFRELLPAALAASDHPSGDGVNTFAISTLVRRHGIKVALSGLGGDEVFGGYNSFHRLAPILRATRAWRWSPAAVRHAAAGVLTAINRESVAMTKAAAVAGGDGSLAAVWPQTRRLFADVDREALLPYSDPDMAGSYEAILDEAFAAAPAAPLWAKISFAESRTYMHDVLLRDTDQMSMAHGLEVRVPLLDHHLAQYVVGLPDAIKRHGGGVKPLLAASVPLPLPPTITATSKRGFVLPLDAWMRGPLRPFCERALGPDGLEGRGVFEPAALGAVWARFLEGGRGITWSRVWTLVALASWLDRHEIEIVQP